MFYSHKRPMGVKLPPGISRLPDKIEAKFQRLPPFSTTAILMKLTGMLLDVTGSENSKMAAYNLVLLIYRLVDKVKVRKTIPTANPAFEISGNSRKKLC
jgi:hypothetical protein